MRDPGLVASPTAPLDSACVYDPGRVVVDMRHTAPARIPRSLVVDGRTVMRDPATVDGVCIHQMGVTLGVGPARLRAAGGDADLAQMLRARDIPAHASAFIEGWVVAPHPLRAYLHHAGRLNATTLGLEVEGLYDGRATGSRRPADTTIDAARAALRWLVETGRSEGMPIRYVYAHRQSSRSRRADPGAWLWREVALWGVDELELETRPDYVI